MTGLSVKEHRVVRTGIVAGMRQAEGYPAERPGRPAHGLDPERERQVLASLGDGGDGTRRTAGAHRPHGPHGPHRTDRTDRTDRTERTGSDGAG